MRRQRLAVGPRQQGDHGQLGVVEARQAGVEDQVEAVLVVVVVVHQHARRRGASRRPTAARARAGRRAAARARRARRRARARARPTVLGVGDVAAVGLDQVQHAVAAHVGDQGRVGGREAALVEDPLAQPLRADLDARPRPPASSTVEMTTAPARVMSARSCFSPGRRLRSAAGSSSIASISSSMPRAAEHGSRAARRARSGSRAGACSRGSGSCRPTPDHAAAGAGQPRRRRPAPCATLRRSGFRSERVGARVRAGSARSCAPRPAAARRPARGRARAPATPARCRRPGRARARRRGWSS